MDPASLEKPQCIHHQSRRGRTVVEIPAVGTVELCQNQKSHERFFQPWDSDQIYDRNPIQLVRQSAKRRRIPDVLSVEEVQRLLDALALRERTLVLLDVGTGLRMSELFGLKWKDVDFRTSEVSVVRSIVMQVKGGKEVTLTPGQTFYEGPDDVHVVGRNASQTKPAKFVVFFVKDKGAPILVAAK